MGFGIILPDSSPIIIIGFIIIILVALFAISTFIGYMGRLFRKIIEYLFDQYRWYHKPNKDNRIALFYSILLPFSGNVYLKESIVSLFLTIITIILMGIEMNNVLNGNVISLYNDYTFYLIVWWILSIIYLGVNILLYNEKNYVESIPTDLDFIDGKKFLRVIPIILIIVFLIVNIGVISNDSLKNEHEAEHLFISSEYPIHSSEDVAMSGNEKVQNFSFKYPDDYMIRDEPYLSYSNINQYYYILTSFINTNNSEDIVTLEIIDSDDSAKETAKNNLKFDLGDGSIWKNIDGGTTKIAGTKGYIIQGKHEDWTVVLFKNNNKLYMLKFCEGAQDKEIMDYFIDSFKFT